MQACTRRTTRRGRPGLPLLAAMSALALTGCAVQSANAPPPPLQHKGESLPTTAGRVRLGQGAYRGPDLAVYRAAARYFRWPILVPLALPARSRLTGATVSRFFAGSFAISARGKAQQVPDSYVPGNPVAPAAYQLRLTYQRGSRTVTLFEAVHPYTVPTGAAAVHLGDGLSGGRTWQASSGGGLAALRYVEGRVDGLYLMAYGTAKSESARTLEAYMGGLRAVAVPPGKTPVATVKGNAFPIIKGTGKGKAAKK